MLKHLGKYMFMIELGYRYIHIFKKTYFHPFISYKPAYKQLSLDRQAYSNQVLEFLNIEIKIVGKIPAHDKVLYAINHRSLLDIMVMEHVFSQHDKSGVWIAKKELLDAFYGKFFKYSGCMSVDLDHSRGLLSFFKSLKSTLARVEDLNVYIFPEGERNKQEGVKEFQSGAAKIAKANKLDVVPVYINDKLESVFKKAPYKEKKIIEVHFGAMLEHQNLESGYKELFNKVKENRS